MAFKCLSFFLRSKVCVSYLLLYTNYLRYRYVTLSKVAVDKTIEGNYTRQTYFRPALRTLSPRASVEERVKGSCACGRREISVLCLFSSRVTCRTKRNPLRGLRKETSRSPAGISIYITLSLFFRVASLSPSPLVRSVSLSLSLLSSPSRRRVPDPRSCLSSRLFPTKDHGEDALARPTSLVTRLVFDPVAADVEETTRALCIKNIVADKSR